MNHHQPDMKALENEIAFYETDAKAQEEHFLENNYKSLHKELEEREHAIAAKALGDGKAFMLTIHNDTIEIIKGHLFAEKLYFGHLKYCGDDFFLFEDTNSRKTKMLDMEDGSTTTLVNFDDAEFAGIRKIWISPSSHKDVDYARMIYWDYWKHSKIQSVDIIFDLGSEAFKNITDSFLRKALLKNKDKIGIQSIITTIQEKQDNLRSLPHKDSFIVQGCAGSGKTMVLLHRIRYLLYNRYINQDEYVFLVPGNGFKNFIERAAKTDFNINGSNIIPYKEYYQSLCSSKRITDHTDINELVFPEEYLGTVYSKEFIRENYKTFFDTFETQINSLIEICEKRLNDIDFEEHLTAEQEIEKLEAAAIAYSELITLPLAKHLEIEQPQNFENVLSILEKIKNLYEEQKNKYDSVLNSDEEIFISPDDERIRSNPALQQLSEKIEAEEAAVKKASIFFVIAHRNKLRQLQKNYENESKSVIAALIEEEKAKRAEEAKNLSMVFDGITLSSLGKIVSDLNSSCNETVQKIEEAKKKLEGTTEYIAYKYSKEIEILNSIIEFSGTFSSESEKLIENLSPCYDLIFDKLQQGKTLLDNLFKNPSKKESTNLKNQVGLFCQESENKIYNSMNTVLLNICKKNIKAEFNINLNNLYKHYWYLSLYCKYLTRPLKTEIKKYIFMDEAQDLNVSEIELIKKLNTSARKSGLSKALSEPVMNLFGDTKQMITRHGIESWDSLSSLISSVHNLDENFRNTDQIIKYCNENLSFTMKSVGVSIEEVQEYNDFGAAFYTHQLSSNEPVFIVKDEYALSDLEYLLSGYDIKDSPIFTVKSVKGLEFKEVFVFDAGMTENEKYISYTRALSKLNVIHSLPRVSDRNETLYVQGNENDIESEE